MNERERLIELIEAGTRLAYDRSLEDVRRIVKEKHHFNSATDRTVSISEMVADYLLENGVIVPSVKVGGEVFCIFRHINDGGWEVSNYKHIVTDGYITKNGLRFRVTNRYGSIKMSDFGDTVFLTREEAEKALEERKGEE